MQHVIVQTIKFSLLFFISVILVMLSTYLYVQFETVDLSSARGATSDVYEETGAGLTRYRIYGNENSRTVVMIPASNGFVEQWESNITPLVKAGYRVITYDLIGRGLSDRPKAPLNLSVFRAQLADMIDKHGGRKVTLVGSSFGGIIAADYALHNNERIEKLILVGPAGWPSEINRASQVVGLPVVGEFVFHFFGHAILKPRVEGYFYNRAEYGWALDYWQKYADYPGFMQSYLSTLRHSPVLDFSEGWRNLGAQKIPTLFVWGRQDVSFPFANAKQAASDIPNAKIVPIDSAAHWVNIEQAGKVNSAILSFLSRRE